MRNIAARFLLLMTAIATPLAYADSFDANTGRLTIDSIQVGNTVYTGVVITIGSVISVGGSKAASSTATGSTVATTCAAGNFTTAAFNAIQEGMSVSQVNQIMGCQYTPSLTLRGSNYLTNSWSVPGTMTYIQVWFDTSGATVTRLYPSTAIPFKTAVGF